MITFAIKLGYLHPTSLCDKPRLWWLGFLLYHHLLWLCFREVICLFVCVKIQTVQRKAQCCS